MAQAQTTIGAAPFRPDDAARFWWVQPLIVFLNWSFHRLHDMGRVSGEPLLFQRTLHSIP
jgi:hypothetical protein